MSTPSGKYDKAGWTKYEFPPDMITAEQNEKKMKLAWPQIKRLMGKQIESRIYSSAQAGDNVSAKEWKALSVRMQAKDMTQRINEEFIQDFMKWLTGRSTFNSTKYFEIVQDEFGAPVSKEVTGGCPWGNKPLTNLPGVSEFLDQGIDRRSKVIEYISKLKLRGPRNLDEAYMYYKYILRKVAVDDDACYEVQEMADFDYPVDPETGETVGPAQVATPPLFDEVRYTANFLMVYSLTVQAPELAAEWILNGAKAFDLEKLGTGIVTLIDPKDTASFLYTNDYDMVRQAGGKYMYVKDWVSEAAGEDEYIERHEQARRMTRERERRRKLRKAGRAPSAKMAAGATSKKGIDLDAFLGPEGRQQSRRLARREGRRDDRIDDDREDLAIALSEEYFGTKNYVSFWALSPSDQDYITSMLLAQSAFASAAQVLATPSATGAAGGPVTFAEPRRNEAKYAFPGEETEKTDKDFKDVKERLSEMARKIGSLPGSSSDPAVSKYLHSILATVDAMSKKMDAKQIVNVYNKEPIKIDNSSLITMVQANTEMLKTVKKVMGTLGTKLDDFGKGPRPPPPTPPSMPSGMATKLGDIDSKLGTMTEVLRGMPKVFADQIPKPRKPKQAPPPRGPDPPPKPPPGPQPPGSVKIESADFASAENVTVEKAEISAPESNLNIEYVDSVLNEYNLGDIQIPILLGSEIGKTVAEELRPYMPKTLNVSLDSSQISVPDIYPQVELPEGFARDVGASIDFTSLEQKIEKLLTERETSRDKQASAIKKQQEEISVLYKELKSMKLRESTKLDQIKKILDNMTPLQQAVAGILQSDQKATEKIKVDMDIEEDPLETKTAKALDLSEETIQKLLSGSYSGINSLKEEIQQLKQTVFNSLNLVDDDAKGNRQVVTSAMIAKGIMDHSASQSQLLNRIKTQYAPDEMEQYLPAKVLVSMYQKLSDPNSVFSGKVKVAEVTDANFAAMKQKLDGLELHLRTGSAEWKLQQQNITLLKNQLETKMNQVKAEATSYTEEQKKIAFAETINLRNQYAKKEAQLSDAAQNYAALAASHAVLKDEFEKFKTRPKHRPVAPDPAVALGKLFTEKIQPVLEKIGNDVTSAIENSSVGLSDDKGAEEDIRREAGSGGIHVPPEYQYQPPIQGVPMVRDPEALPQEPEYMAQQEYHKRFFGNAQPPAQTQAENVGLPELFVSPAAVRARNALRGLVDEVLERKPHASALTVLLDPITAANLALQNKLPANKLGVDPVFLTPEERLARNEMNLVYQYTSTATGIAGQTGPDSAFNKPLSTYKKEERYELVDQALNILAEGNEPWQKNHNLERLTDLITDYQGSLDRMRDGPTETAYSVSADEYMGKLNGSELRHRTGFTNPDGNAIKPASSRELDGYTTLARVARDMIDNYYSQEQDAVGYLKLQQAIQEYAPFKDVAFVRSSPLYKAIEAGTPDKIRHALSAEGTMHLDRTYYSKSVKLRNDMLYDSFQRSLYPVVNDQSYLRPVGDPSIDEQVERADHAYYILNKSGVSEKDLMESPDYTDDVLSIDSEETSMYLQAFLKASALSSVTKSLVLQKETGVTEEEVRAVGADNESLKKDAYYALEEYNALANDANKVMSQYSSDAYKEVHATRKKTVDDIANVIAKAMSASLTPEFKQLSTRNSEAQSGFGLETADAATEAVDTLTGLGTNSIIERLKRKRQTYETTTTIPSGKVIAAQVKKAVNIISGGKVKDVLDQIVQTEEKRQEIVDIKKRAIEWMKKETPQLF